MSGRFIYFWKTCEQPYGVFSQWAITPFTDPATSITYNSAEQYMMHQKAVLFSDTTIAHAILAETDPRKSKSLGAKVAGFSEDVWVANRLEIVTRGNALKFGQDAEMKRILLQSGDATIVEASPYDRIWGIGFTKREATSNRDKWGLNLLGEALMAVRRELLAQDT
ncbi:hypothetical protein HDU86_006032 [Geranomyces michiganensis]|nr:hypothetical protein HDU86_006032 [Geranomyces michiganensis]